ncbi:hemolysin D [Opitutaceae bacterium TAV5]|nr:hemolysin D [Opitutaceae bacterium TAV5]
MRHIQLLVTTLAAALLAGCSKTDSAAGTAKEPPPVEVGVVTLATESVTLTRSLPGRTSAWRIAEVRARVNGIVLKRLFEEGADVKEGEQLYQIDPEPYEAALASAEAALARAEASHASARLDVERYAELIKVNAVSRQGYDDAFAAEKVAAADIASAKAAVTTARINLNYTKVYAPISGHIGKSWVTEGAYVQAGSATLLATIQQTDPIYVDVVQPASQILRLKEDLEKGRLRSTPDGKAQVRLFFDDNRQYPEAGTLRFADITVDPTTSSITVRAVFPNPRGDLFPGMFVRAQLVEGINPDALLVPQEGVSRNMRGEAVALVVGEDNKVEQRVLQTDRTIGNKWLVTSGLKAGDQVIVENLQRIRVGTHVKPVAPSWARPDSPKS